MTDKEKTNKQTVHVYLYSAIIRVKQWSTDSTQVCPGHERCDLLKRKESQSLRLKLHLLRYESRVSDLPRSFQASFLLLLLSDEDAGFACKQASRKNNNLILVSHGAARRHSRVTREGFSFKALKNKLFAVSFATPRPSQCFHFHAAMFLLRSH